MDHEPTTLTIDAVARAILDIQRDEGALPAERQLAERLEIKRHMLRRALSELRERGALPQLSPRLRRMPMGQERAQQVARDTNPVEVMEMRLIIEPPLARLAAVRATPNQIDEMRNAAAQRRRAGSVTDLHRMIAAASGNGLARVLHEMIRVIDHDVRFSSRLLGIEPKTDAEEHREIVEAIGRRDADAAEAAMRTHLLSIHRALSAVLS